MGNNSKQKKCIFKRQKNLGTVPSSKSEYITDGLQLAVQQRRCMEQFPKRGVACARLLAKLLAIATVLGAAGYGMYKGISYTQKKWEDIKYTRYINSVQPEHQEAAKDLYNKRHQDVKMVHYEVGESQKKGSGLFSEYTAELNMYYDANNDGKADYLIRQIVDSELFYGWGEGSVANEVHGSWKKKLNDVLIETRRAGGKITVFSTGQVINFSKERE